MKSLTLNRKAQGLGGLYSGILIIAAIGILLTIVLYIFANVEHSTRTPLTAVTVINETVTPSTAGVTLAGGNQVDGSCGAITAVYNTTNSYVITAGNYTQTGCTLSNSTGKCVMCGPTWKVSYPYTWSANTTSSDAITTMSGQFVTFLPWLGIILLVLAAGVVLFFVIRSFASSGKGV